MKVSNSAWPVSWPGKLFALVDKNTEVQPGAWGLVVAFSLSCCLFLGMTRSGIIWKRAPERSISSMMHHKAIFRINPNWTPLEWLQKGQVAYGSYLMDLQWSLHSLQPYCCMRLYLSSVKVLTGNTTCCFKPSSRTPKQTTSCHIQHVQFLLALVLALWQSLNSWIQSRFLQTKSTGHGKQSMHLQTIIP